MPIGREKHEELRRKAVEALSTVGTEENQQARVECPCGCGRIYIIVQHQQHQQQDGPVV